MIGVPCEICLLMWLCVSIVEGACDVCLVSVCERCGDPMYWCGSLF